LRILFLYPTIFPDLIGGVEQRNFELASALARRGHEVTLAGLLYAPRPATPLLRFLGIGRLENIYNQAGKRSTHQALRFAARVPTLSLRDYDLVETANIPYVHLLPLAASCRLAGKPLLVTWYEYWDRYWYGYVGRLRAPAYQLVEWMTAQLGTGVTTTSRLTRDRLARRRLRGSVEVIPCGIHVTAVRAAAAEMTRGDGAPLVFAGRLLADKRLEMLLQALTRVAPHLPGPLLTLFGVGPDRERLTRIAAELGLADRVVFRGQVEDNVEVWRGFGRARLAVQPSEHEGFGLFPLEAMAAGLPVLYCQSSESALGELVRDGEEGVCAPAHPEGLAAAVLRLLGDDGERERLARRAVERAAAYDWEEIARQFEQRCRLLLPAQRLSPPA
jgi:glycosyltransferase involved in cell wall biosynthesis